MTAQALARMMLELQARGCHNINFVTPEHVVPQILEALAAAIDGGLRLPIVYNTSAYDSLQSLQLMDGVVDIYMPDFKYWTRSSALTTLKLGTIRSGRWRRSARCTVRSAISSRLRGSRGAGSWCAIW